MYDVATQSVSKLSGELSSAFVDAAEANSNDDEDTSASSSNIMENRVPLTKRQINRNNAASDDLKSESSKYYEDRVSIIYPKKHYLNNK